jgi:hypothetical protein
MAFELDGVPFTTEPSDCEWKFKIVGYDGNGLPVLSPYADVKITCPCATNTEFDEWYSHSRMDGYTASITLRLPAPDDATWTNYAGCYLKSVDCKRRDTVHVYGMTIVATKVAY